MVAEKYGVQLSPGDRSQLERLIRSGQHSARVINRARILTSVRRGRIGRRAARPSLDGTLYKS